ncbi:MAG TPA: M28 family peptidase [Thermoanaerobaculia bacterium]
MRRVWIAWGLLGALVSGSGAADPASALSPRQRATAEALRDRALKGTRAAALATALCDEAGARMPGSEGDRLAVAWGQRAARELGLTNVRAERVPVNIWLRGEETGWVVAPTHQPLALTALGGSVGTPPGGVEAEIVEAASLEDLDAKPPEAVRGKIVFVNRRMRRTADFSGYGEMGRTRSRSASSAAKLGAVGVLIRSLGTNDDRAPHTGGMRYLEGIPKIPAAALSLPDADLLERLLRRGGPVRVRFTLGCRDGGPGESANVLAEVPGRGKPEEIVLLACHLDSWDLGVGAVDDAAGCGIVLEAARLISELPPDARPRRTIRVVLFANEEHGLAGGKEYVRAHAAELPRHVAAIEADAGSGLPNGLSWNAGPSAEPAVSAIASVLAPAVALPLEAKGTGGADISRLLPAGVPLFGLRQDSTRYFDLHHTANDTPDKLEPASMDRGVATVAVWAYVAADLETPFERIPEAKRKTTEE